MAAVARRLRQRRRAPETGKSERRDKRHGLPGQHDRQREGERQEEHARQQPNQQIRGDHRRRRRPSPRRRRGAPHIRKLRRHQRRHHGDGHEAPFDRQSERRRQEQPQLAGFGQHAEIQPAADGSDRRRLRHRRQHHERHGAQRKKRKRMRKTQLRCKGGKPAGPGGAQHKEPATIPIHAAPPGRLNGQPQRDRRL